MAGSLRLFRVAGIDVAIHASWLVIFALVTWSLATAYFPNAVRDATTTQVWILGVIASLLLFASVLVHELAHSIVAKSRGIDVHSITLFIFGGVSNLTGEAKRPSVEFLIAIVGPLTSFLIAAISYGVVVVADDSRMVVAVASYLALINLVLGLFNLVPGFPLDGGRVLRSIIWRATGDQQRATRIAVGVGQAVAWLLIVFGFWRVLIGDLFGGLWTIAIGWFLQSAAGATLQQSVLETHLRGLRVRDIVRPDPTAATPDTTVAELIDDYILPGSRRAVPIVDGGRLVGIVTLSDLRDVPVEARAQTPVASIMSKAPDLVTVSPDMSLQDALERLAEGDFEQLPVVEDGKLVGLLTRADLLRVIQIRQVLDLPPTRR
ncbi:MAG TPA: site-2 protease family protein [Candidatus Limnocylindrales bacterium]|nr:site-2 protease family protein [Candidatus Limnocylindrales bacterium]